MRKSIGVSIFTLILVMGWVLGYAQAGFYVIAAKKQNWAPVEKTGDDGDYQAGTGWPNPRFVDKGDQTVVDRLTNLMWTAGANIYGSVEWSQALSDCNSCTVGGHEDWRLANVKELQSLIHYGYASPALSNASGTSQWTAGDAFIDVQSSFYWTSTTYAGNTDYAHVINVGSGAGGYSSKGAFRYIWCVRDGY